MNKFHKSPVRKKKQTEGTNELSELMDLEQYKLYTAND